MAADKTTTRTDATGSSGDAARSAQVLMPDEPGKTSTPEGTTAVETDPEEATGAAPWSGRQSADANTDDEGIRTGADSAPPASEADGGRTDTPPPLTPARAVAAPAGPGRAGTFFAMILGGFLAAMLGALAALYYFPQGWWVDPGELEQRVTALEARQEAPDVAGALAPLAQRMDAVEAAVAPVAQRLEALEAVEPADVAAVEERLAGLAERLDAAEAVDLDAIDARLQALGARIEAAEADAPGPDLGPLERAVADLTNRLDALEATRGIEIAAAAEAAVDAALAEARAAQDARALELDQAAETLAADQASLEARAALTDLSVAAETGEPAPDALARLSAVADPPPALAAFADGVPTLGALQAEFPAYARQALRAAPVAQDAPTGDRVMTFLRAQTGARSLAPRAGADPDAVLSRAEAAVRAGRLGEALDEIAVLPPASAAELEPWRQRAEQRQSALAALGEMQARLGPQ